jgi:hypothetical protein
MNQIEREEGEKNKKKLKLNTKIELIKNDIEEAKTRTCLNINEIIKSYESVHKSLNYQSKQLTCIDNKMDNVNYNLEIVNNDFKKMNHPWYSFPATINLFKKRNYKNVQSHLARRSSSAYNLTTDYKNISNSNQNQPEDRFKRRAFSLIDLNSKKDRLQLKRNIFKLDEIVTNLNQLTLEQNKKIDHINNGASIIESNINNINKKIRKNIIKK